MREGTGEPGPVQKPRVPLLIAGGGERVTLRQVARFADMANFGGRKYAGAASDLADIRRKCAVLRNHCEAIERPYESVLPSHMALPLVLAETATEAEAKAAALPDWTRSGGGLFAGTPAAAISFYRALVGAGLRYFIPFVHGADIETVQLLGEHVVPAVAGA